MSTPARNARTALLALLLVCSMTGLAFASVPLYRIFCDVTGFGGTPLRAAETPPAGDGGGETVSVRFDANADPALPWEFAPEKTTEESALGVRKMAFYSVRNLSDEPVTGTATFNVSPALAGPYFAKIQCFCFTDQRLEPGEEMRMPVVYYVDPGIARDPSTDHITEITLSYTFYPVDEGGSGG
ncbi:MAG: cytochrome c oxidase assembly protein [Sphingomonadaceae bacterium]